MPVPTSDGITAKIIATSRLTTRVLFSGPESGPAVLFLHGNVSSATWWEETMLALPTGWRGIAPDQRSFGDADPAKKIDATRGMGDLSDDAAALLDTLGIEKAHVVGNSLGGMVTWQMMKDHPHRLLSVTVVDPGSPYGFGATKDLAGTPCNPDDAGSGGGLSNPELIRRLAAGDTTTESPFSPRSALRTVLVKPPFISPREDALVASMNSTHIGPEDVPGDSTQSPHWPHMAPGLWGPTNATSPRYQKNIQKIIECPSRPPVLWVRGSHDMAVSDTAASCPGFLGKIGLLPGWPGEALYPPQPMVGQTRAVLEQYAAAGGDYEEFVVQDAGHVPFLEKPEVFNPVFHKHLARSNAEK